MAQELRINMSMGVVSPVLRSLCVEALFDLSGADFTLHSQQLSTSPEVLDLGDISPPAGFVFVCNLDATNDVIVALANGSDEFGLIGPGEFGLWTPDGSGSIYVSGSAGTPSIEVAAVETAAFNSLVRLYQLAGLVTGQSTQVQMTATPAGSSLTVDRQVSSETAVARSSHADLYVDTDTGYEVMPAMAGQTGRFVLAMRNLDAANFVSVALDSGVSTKKFARLKAGCPLLLPLYTDVLPYAKADTAEVRCDVLCAQN